MQRFYDKCMPEPNSGCIIWMGVVEKHGYGRVKYKGKMRLAHLVACELAGKVIENQGCHKCHVKSCVNPDHIIDGTQSFNLSTNPEGKNKAAHEKAMATRSAGRALPKSVRFKNGRYAVAVSPKRGVYKYLGTFDSIDEALLVRDKHNAEA